MQVLPICLIGRHSKLELLLSELQIANKKYNSVCSEVYFYCNSINYNSINLKLMEISKY